MSRPSNSQPSHAAMPERHCWGERSLRVRTGFSGTARTESWDMAAGYETGAPVGHPPGKEKHTPPPRCWRGKNRRNAVQPRIGAAATERGQPRIFAKRSAECGMMAAKERKGRKEF